MSGSKGARTRRLRTVALAAVLLASGGTNALAAVDSGRWTLTEFAQQLPPETALVAVAPVTASDVWVVGSSPGDTARTTALTHWDGQQWQAVESVGPGYLTDVAAVDTADVWAVGGQETGSTLAAHWDGRTWTTVPTPKRDTPPPGVRVQMNAVAPVTGDEVWAAGCVQSWRGDIASEPLVQRWNGVEWADVALPPLPHEGGGCLTDILPLAGDDIWAVGYASETGRSHELTMHWDGSSWSVLPATPEEEPGTSHIPEKLAAVNGTDVYAVGVSVSGGDNRSVILHRVGDRWDPVPADEWTWRLNGITPDGHGRLVVAGQSAADAGCVVRHGSGDSWKTEEVPPGGCLSVSSLGVVPGTDTIWAVGVDESYRPFAAYSPNWQ